VLVMVAVGWGACIRNDVLLVVVLVLGGAAGGIGDGVGFG